MNIRTRQKCRLLRKHYDLFILHIVNNLSEEDKNRIRYLCKRMKEATNNHEIQREST